MSSITFRSRLALGLGAALMLGATLSACGTSDTAPVSNKVDDPAVSNADSRGPVTYMAECLDDNIVQKPKTFTLTCADGGMALEQLKWKGWGEDKATATGVVTTNLCEPSCAEGKVIGQDVTVYATGIIDGEASARYTKLRVIAINGEEGQGIDDETFDLPGIDAGDASAE